MMKKAKPKILTEDERKSNFEIITKSPHLRSKKNK